MTYRFLLLFLLLPVLASAYSVVRKDGKIFTGELIRQNAAGITLKDHDGITISFRSDQIDWEKTTAALQNEEKHQRKEIKLPNLEYETKQITPPAHHEWTGERLTFDFKDIDIRDFFRFIADFTHTNLILDPAVKGTLTMKMHDVPWDQALDVVCKTYGYGYQIEGNSVNVKK